MSRAALDSRYGHPVSVWPGTDPSFLVVCEHASRYIPPEFANLGVVAEALDSHIAWDPGATQVAEQLAQSLNATYVEGRFSRLLYDCNRPPRAYDAIPQVSEIFDVPGNLDLSDLARQERVEIIHDGFHDALQDEVEEAGQPILLTIHSFTPVYKGVARAVELGILHGADDRLAKAMLDRAPDSFETQLNAPYGPADGVAYTLDRHGTNNGLLNVMIEIRNDLIAQKSAQTDMATYLSDWIKTTAEAMR